MVFPPLVAGNRASQSRCHISGAAAARLAPPAVLVLTSLLLSGCDAKSADPAPTELQQSTPASVGPTARPAPASGAELSAGDVPQEAVEPRGPMGPDHPMVPQPGASREPLEPGQVSPEHDAAQADRQPSAPAQPSPGTVSTAPGVWLGRQPPRVELEAEVCLDAGWLEQVACSPGTREHESLVAVRARPRDVHAALLLLGLEPGAPGSWRVEGDALVEVAPTGPPLRVLFRWYDADGASRETPAAEWIRDVVTGGPPALDRWLFAGSLIRTMPDGSQRYQADGSGSIVGLVTFGDEIVALPTVKPDAESIAEPQWEAWTERLPPVGTRVMLVLEAIPTP